jgi:hypothetical protein
MDINFWNVAGSLIFSSIQKYLINHPFMSITTCICLARDAEIKYVAPGFKKFAVSKKPRSEYLGMTELLS